ncbi:oxidoreductase [Saccharopolyspora hirsuta]|uniref:Oxidoreductase n=1 Tax=Saccharopolyspora hirsuta TaxID=1837 RepID=A0A5M7B9F1_SACHI|nr:oxidoreductase [Saccharopolyspora hirsuta]KAA5826029.1 oxidoreductase [Saccharopolyspora hirsuta]
MTGWARNTAEPLTDAERRFDELLAQGRTAESTADQVQPAGVPGAEQEIRGEYLASRLIESLEEGGRLFARRGAQPLVIVVEHASITGQLDLRNVDLPHLLEFVGCRFENAPDLRQARLAGLVLWSCRFPGLHARNLAVGNDVVLRDCASVGGILDLADADLGGSLLLNDSELRNPGQRCVYADRLAVSGALLGIRLRTAGEIRIPGAKIGGNLTLSGGALRNRGRNAINATGIRIGGSLRLDVDPATGRAFTAAGTLRLPSAQISGDLRLRDAVLEPGARPPRRGDSDHDDPTASLIADRCEIRGDVQLDQDFRSGGTLRLVSAVVGGNLRMAGAAVDVGWLRSPAESVLQPVRAVNLDGARVSGNLDAGAVAVRGQWRMTDVQVGGSIQLTRAQLTGPRTDVLVGSRLSVGSNLELRAAEVVGSLQLPGAQIGANIDLRGAQLTKPAWHHHRNTYKPSLDLRAARIERDLICAEGEQAFLAEGTVQLRWSQIGRHVNFSGCELGDGASRTAFNASGVQTQELTLLPRTPPRGRVTLRQAQCELLADNSAVWESSRGVDCEDFSYQNFAEPFELDDQQRVRQRLGWLRATADGAYQPGPYDQLAEVFRSNGLEEHAVSVLIEKQRHRYAAIARTARPGLRWPVQLWSWLQRATVGYGYRPMRAVGWLVAFAVVGTAWFSFHPLIPVNEQDRPVWNPLLYTLDQMLPVVSLGHDDMWQARGVSQWVTVALVAAGWTLATTVAAGISRALHRER